MPFTEPAQHQRAGQDRRERTGEVAAGNVGCGAVRTLEQAMVFTELRGRCDASLYTCLQILSVSVFEKTQISCALQADRSQSIETPIANQLNLFDF